MKTVRADFFLSTQHLGTCDLPRGLTLSVGFSDPAQSTAYFCSKCGDVWGRIVVEGDPTFKLCSRHCAHHGSGLFQRGVGTLWHHYPKEVLAREVSILANYNPSDINDLIYTG